MKAPGDERGFPIINRAQTGASGVGGACAPAWVDVLGVSPDTDERSDDVFLDPWAPREAIQKTRRQLRETRAALNRPTQHCAKDIGDLKKLVKYQVG